MAVAVTVMMMVVMVVFLTLFTLCLRARFLIALDILFQFVEIVLRFLRFRCQSRRRRHRGSRLFAA